MFEELESELASITEADALQAYETATNEQTETAYNETVELQTKDCMNFQKVQGLRGEAEKEFEKIKEIFLKIVCVENEYGQDLIQTFYPVWQCDDKMHELKYQIGGKKKQLQEDPEKKEQLNEGHESS